MEQPPQCRCGQPAELRTVRKEGPNHGRQFWGCSRFPDASACKFFQWAKPGAEDTASQASQQQGSGQQASQQQWQSPHGSQPPQQWQSPAAQQHPAPYSGGQAQQQRLPHPSQQQSPHSQSRPLSQQPPQQQQWSQQQLWSQPQQQQPQQQWSQPKQQQPQQQWSQPPSQATPPSQGRLRYASPASLAAAGKPYIPAPSPAGPQSGPKAAPKGWHIDLTASPPGRPSQQRLHSQQPASGAPGQWDGSQGAFDSSQDSRGSQQAPPPSLHQQWQQQQQQQPQPGWPGGSQSPGSWYGPPIGSQERAKPAGSPPLPQAQEWGTAVASSPCLPRRNRDGMIMGGQGPGPPIRVNLQVLDGERFGAQFKFNEPLKEYIKALSGAASSRWDPTARMWTFSREHYCDVLRALQGGPLPIVISPLPEEGLEARPEEQRGGTQPDEAEVQERLRRLPSDLWQRLYSFQREGVRRGVAMGGRCLVADEMGLGKTVQALMIAACFGPEDWPLLIITPATMKLVWEEAVRTWLPPELAPSPRNLAVITDGASMDSKLGSMDASSPRRVVVVSYEMARKLEGRTAEFHTIIADESHLLKTLDTQRTRVVTAMARSARRVVLCTGTPALARPLELFPQIDMLRPGLFGSLREYGMRYCDGRPAEFPGPGVIGGYDFRGASNLAELSQQLEQHLMIRRLKEQVLGDLPEKIRKRIPVETHPDHRAALQQTRRAMEQVKRDEAGGLIDAQTAALAAQRLAGELYRQTGPAKVAAAAEHVRALLEAGHKLLVFAHHAEVLDALQEQALAGVPFVRIDGQVDNAKRKPLVDRFQHDERCRAALLSITAAGVGITLTAASVVVFAELYWNPGSLVQAEDRAHRMGQRHPLEVHYLVAPGTADDAIWQKCKQKLAVVGGTLGQEHAEEAFEVPSTQRRLTPAKRRAGIPAAATPGGSHQRQQHQQQHQQQRQQQQHHQQHQQQHQQQRQQQQQPEVITISDSESDSHEARVAARRAQRAPPTGASAQHEQLMVAAEARAAAAGPGSGGWRSAGAPGRGTQLERAWLAAAAQDGTPPGPGTASCGTAVAGAAEGPASSEETARWDEGGSDGGAAQAGAHQAQQAQHRRPRRLAGGGGEAGEDLVEAGGAVLGAEVDAAQHARRKRARPVPQAASPVMPQSPRDVAFKLLEG